MTTHKIVFFGGKGGVGKSTSSSAFALQQADQGKRVLLVSTDPAHNLQDLFQKRIGHKITSLTNQLDGLEINAQEESKRYIKGVKENIKGLVHAHRLHEVHRQIDLAASSPGADESALFDRLVSIILENTSTYDSIIFDTAPTGHTIRLLTLPELMEAWINGMLKRRKVVTDNYSSLLNDGEPVEDPIYQTLMERKRKFSLARTWLLDNEKTRFLYVLTPEKLPIEETDRAIEQLKKHQMDVSGLIVNKCLPDEANDSAFFKQRKQLEDGYKAEIQQRFTNQSKVFIPLQERDIASVEELRALQPYLTI
ncbi:ArsA family ATPase [Geomicrobium sp. JCM 19038]|uniref:ArsA family ATPase n=1 Tax=Geomicrobium sp. JCM 19038 TaxID=1460635 RepID=UPI00045F44B6|nr:ArsA family ATPase [Geomicrobium sp. JCM 19038]GAK10039.1 arsenical pump-driving ATPase [Geomicrobium sp. JCM 19038]